MTAKEAEAGLAHISVPKCCVCGCNTERTCVMDKCNCECGCQCERTETAEPVIDWEQRRWDAAVAAMQGMLADADYDPIASEVADGAMLAADALIARFKGETK